MRRTTSCFGCSAALGRIGALSITITMQEGERGMATRHTVMLCWRCARQRDLVVRLTEPPSRRIFTQPNRSATRSTAAEPDPAPPLATRRIS